MEAAASKVRGLLCSVAKFVRTSTDRIQGFRWEKLSRFLYTILYPNTSRTTFPCTSVSRKSRPWKRKVSFS